MTDSAVALLLPPTVINIAQYLLANPPVIARTIALLAPFWRSSGALLASTSYARSLEPACAIIRRQGKYRFSDYVRIGGGLTLAIMIVTLLLVPIFWPLLERDQFSICH
jgi:di/tricarboxylate transporter